MNLIVKIIGTKTMLKNLKQKILKYQYFYGFKITLLLMVEKYLDSLLKQRKVNHYPQHLVKDSDWINQFFNSNLWTTLGNLFRSLFIRYPDVSHDSFNPLKLPKIKPLKDSSILIICSASEDLPRSLKEALQKQTQLLDIKSLHTFQLKDILNFDSIFLYSVPFNFQLHQYLKYAHLSSIPSFFWSPEIHENKQIALTLNLTDFLVTPNTQVYEYYKNERSHVMLVENEDHYWKIDQAFEQAMQNYQQRYIPKVSLIVFSLIASSDLTLVLESYLQQIYQGDWEIIFINTLSSGNLSESIKHFWDSQNTYNNFQKIPRCKIINIENNAINIWQQILDISTGELLIFLKNDCIIPSDFILNYVHHQVFEGDDFIGISTIKNLDQDSCSLTNFKDSINSHSFLNLIQSNFSLKRNGSITHILEANALKFTHEISPFNWMAVEAGFYLYKRGARFEFIPDALCSSLEPLKSYNQQQLIDFLSNLSAFLKAYPDFFYVARRWIGETSTKILNELDSSQALNEDEKQKLQKLLKNIFASSFYFIPRKLTNTLRILTYPWHISHQYELYKLPYEFTLITDLGSPQSKGWNFYNRPIPSNIQFRSIHDIQEKDFDLAILHFDENVLNPEYTQGVIGKNWGNTFKYFCEKINLPKVAICHGTPQFYGQYDITYNQANLMQDIEESKQKIVNYLKDILVITNSYQANREWGFKNTQVIWHGFDPLEFPPSTYDKGILAPFDKSVTSRPHYRGYAIYKQVFDDFPLEYFPSVLQVKEPPVVYLGNQYAQTRFRNYVDNIRQHSIFFNPTLRSPMPRLRGEAMMCGLVTVSMKNHDVDLFIENGVNGFYSADPLELKDYLLFLAKNPQETEKIGIKSRELALDIFNHDRYLKAWQNIILSLT